MRVSGRRKTSAFFITLGACLVALAIALYVGWILLNWRQVALLVLGIIFFSTIIAGLILNTTFLVREIRRNEQHDSFINAVTHELKTPIASIRLYLETLQTRELSDEKRREFYDVMLADSNRLLHTVEQVLRAGQMGHGRGRDTGFSIMRVDLSQVVHECLDLARLRYPPLQQSPEALSFAQTTEQFGPPIVMGDADELRVAVSNLIDNAVKYSDQTIEISVSLETLDAKRVSLRVTDRGIGIPSGQLKRIYKRFYRVPRHVMARIKGTGLGLFIVRSIVEKHRGRTFAESEGEGRGSTFTIVLPRAESS